jgi:hypothetical protein
VPTYKSWLYHSFYYSAPLGSNPFTVNSPGSSSVTFESVYQKIPKNPDGSLLNCNFEATNDLEFVVPQDGSATPATSLNWPSWVVDYEISRLTDMTQVPPYYIINPDLIPFYLPGKFNPPLCSWLRFDLEHNALIHFLPAIIEEGNVATPGEWRIDLSVNQNATYNQVIIEGLYHFSTLEQMNAFIDGISPFDVFIADEDQLTVEVGYAVPSSAEGSGTWSGSYKAPSDFTCPITSGHTYRFENIIPYDLPPIKVSSTNPVIPAGYGQPKQNVVYPFKPERDAEFQGDSFDLSDYYAPPYIDVKHIKLES